MGLISRLMGAWKEPEPQGDPQGDLIRDLLSDQRAQRQEMSRLLDRVLDQSQEQARLASQLLSQYVAVGENQTTTMDSRMFAKEQRVEDEMWEPLGVNPFKGLVE